MHIELIREFQQFAISQNLSKAAKELHITQSCLSKHMSELEAETGLRLINHDGKRVSLAPAGKHFAQETATIMALWDDCIICCKRIQKEPAGRISVSIFLDGNKANNLLFLLGKEYRSLHPGVEITYSKLVGLSPKEALDEKVFDIVADMRCETLEECESKAEQNRLKLIALSSDPLAIWFRKDNKLARKEAFELEEFERIPIMTSVTNSFDYMRELTRGVFEKNGMVPFFKPVHFDVDSPASFFLSDFDNKSVMLTSIGMIENQCLRIRDDIAYRILDDPRLKAISFMMAKKENVLACDFLDFASKYLLKSYHKKDDLPNHANNG